MKTMQTIITLILVVLSLNIYASSNRNPGVPPSLNWYQIEREGEFAHISVKVNKGSAEIKSVLSFYLRYSSENEGEGRFFELNLNKETGLYEKWIQITNNYILKVGSSVQMIDVQGNHDIVKIDDKEFLGEPSFKIKINRYIDCKSDTGRTLNFKELTNGYIKILVDGVDLARMKGGEDNMSRNDGYEILNIHNFKAMLPEAEKVSRHEVYVNGNYPVQNFANTAFLFPIELGRSNVKNFTAFVMEGMSNGKLTTFTCDMELSNTIRK